MADHNCGFGQPLGVEKARFKWHGMRGAVKCGRSRHNGMGMLATQCRPMAVAGLLGESGTCDVAGWGRQKCREGRPKWYNNISLGSYVQIAYVRDENLKQLVWVGE